MKLKILFFIFLFSILVILSNTLLTGAHTNHTSNTVRNQNQLTPHITTVSYSNPYAPIRDNHINNIQQTALNLQTSAVQPEKTFLKTTSASSLTTTQLTGFISTWNTTDTSAGSSNANQITLPLVNGGTYNFNVSWGDGITNNITTYNQPEATHTYSSPGINKINITGTIIGWEFNNGGDAQKITDISNWGPLQLGNNGNYFRGASNLIITANDSLNLNGTTNLASMFNNCTSLSNPGSLNSWNVSQVTNMAGMFAHATNFNQPLNLWNVSQVTSMANMFYFATSFNQPLNSWDVSHVTQMEYMFNAATNFNQSLNSWDVSHVTQMEYMFNGAINFNQPLNSWVVSHVTHMEGMFLGATYFNQSLNSWNVSSVKYMGQMFEYASSFNQPLSAWNVSQVLDLSTMFQSNLLSVSNYNQLLISWSSLPTLQPNLIFDAAFSMYTTIAQNARNYLINTYNWTIHDGGLVRVPNAPQLSLYSSGLGFITLSWRYNDSLYFYTNYNIYRSTTMGSGYTLIGTIVGNVTYAHPGAIQYTDHNVAYGNTYYYVIKSIIPRADVISNYSNQITVPYYQTIISSTNTESSPLYIITVPNYTIFSVILILLIPILIVGVIAFIVYTRNKKKKEEPIYKQGNFDSEEEYHSALKLGATTKKEFLLVLQTKAPNYDIAKEITDCGFPNYDIFLLAQEEGITTYQIWRTKLNQDEKLASLTKRAKKMPTVDFMQYMGFKDKEELLNWVFTLPENSPIEIDGEMITLQSDASEQKISGTSDDQESQLDKRKTTK